jgi:hypothetical protein
MSHLIPDLLALSPACCQRESRLAWRRCPRARLWAWMALARVLVNCRAFRVSLDAALEAFWLWALRVSAC